MDYKYVSYSRCQLDCENFLLSYSFLKEKKCLPARRNKRALSVAAASCEAPNIGPFFSSPHSVLVFDG